MMLGWANYLTLYSKESNLSSENLQRVNLNEPDLEQLYTDLRSAFNEEWSRYIIQYRINGPYVLTDDDDEPLLASAPFDFDPAQESTTTFTQILDLFDSYTKATNLDGDEIILKSPFNTLNAMQVLPILMENATTFEGLTIPGRINVMQASRRVLTAVPGMTEDLLDSILRVREFELDDPDGFDRNRKYETWLYAEGFVDLQTMQILLPFLCCGGDVYQAEVVGYFDDGVGSSRAEVIIDTTIPIPRILFGETKAICRQAIL
ncbi:MAG: hypothetical protein R3C03_02385 [Pirellulaceae bacterium]